MVLVTVVTIMSEDDVRRKPFLEVFEVFFDLGSAVRKKTIAKIFDYDCLLARSLQKQSGAFEGFFLPYAAGTQHDPVEFQIGVLLEPAKNGAAATDFNIIGMRAQAQDLAR